MKVLILGGNGLLGNALLNILSKNYEVIATTRNKLYKDIKNFIYVDDLTRLDFLDKLIIDVDPDIIINALSVRDVGNKKLYQLKLIFTVIPHHISSFCRRLNKRFIQISTDGVFSGKTGNYKEEDIPDPIDSYGICKFLGEPNQKNTTVIRTSMIGHSFNNDYGLLDWFIKQNECTLYKNAVFSGLPVYEIARIISQYFIENKNLDGIYHLASEPISKLNLLTLVNNVYNLNIIIHEDDSFYMDRSLDSSKFQNKTGYRVLSWDDMITQMKEETYKQ